MSATLSRRVSRILLCAWVATSGMGHAATQPLPGPTAPGGLLSEVPQDGGVLEVGPWRYRKPVIVERSGVQALEFDLEVVAAAQPGFGDVRLVRGSNQVPYILGAGRATRVLQPGVERLQPDPERRQVSGWQLQLPRANLGLVHVTCMSQTPVFRREALLRERVRDGRGGWQWRTLGSASWARMPGHEPRPLVLDCDAAPQTDTVVLEVDDGDNAPLDLARFECSWKTSRLYFRASAGEAVFLYYGNSAAQAPRYDLHLVAEEMLEAEKASATLGPEVELQRPFWGRDPTGAAGRWVFWGVLALVVAVLAGIVARLFPGAREAGRP